MAEDEEDAAIEASEWEAREQEEQAWEKQEEEERLGRGVTRRFSVFLCHFH